MPPPGGWDDDIPGRDGLEPDFLLRADIMRELVYQRTGIVMNILDGFRPPELQIQRRIENCGNTHFDIYLKSPSLCNPVTAKPGTSDHERGRAIDWDVHWDADPFIREAANMVGIYYNVPSEKWHCVPGWAIGKPVPDVTQYLYLVQDPGPAPAPPTQEIDMGKYAECTRESDGAQFAFAAQDDNSLWAKWAAKGEPLWVCAWVNVQVLGAPIVDIPVQHVIPYIHDERLHVELHNATLKSARLVATDVYGWPVHWSGDLFPCTAAG